MKHNYLKHKKVISYTMIMLGIIVITTFAYYEVKYHQFLNFDDDVYIFENVHVQKGFALDAIQWAFGFTGIAYWQPLTWISHMLDYRLFGLSSKAHHLMSLAIHIINSIILFLILLKMTKSRYKAGLVSVLFAIHPLNVESVAWVAERKTLLSSLFLMMALYSYIYYVECKNRWMYVLVIALYALGLMSKPSIIVFPLLLLVLDYWPLGRYTRENDTVNVKKYVLCILMKIDDRFKSMRRSNIVLLVIEKIPLILISIVSFYISMNSMSKYNIVIDFERVPLDLRINNLFVSIQKYISNIVMPFKLSIYYPFPNRIDVYEIILSIILIVIVTFIALKYKNNKQWIITGWLWFLIALAPASGLVQAGLWPQMANRFMYIPIIGIFIMLIWTYDSVCKWKRKAVLSIVLSFGLIGYYSSLTRIQNIYYSNSYALFSRAIEVTDDNFVAYNNAGTALNYLNRTDEAIDYFYKAITINPKYEKALNNYALLLSKKGDYITASYYYKKAIALHPYKTDAYFNFALNEYLSGKTDGAFEYLEKALLIDSNNANAHMLLGRILLEKGKAEEAIDHYLISTKMRPSDAEANIYLAQAYEHAGRYKEAIDQYKRMILKGIDNEGKLYCQIAALKCMQNQEEECMMYIKLSSEKGFNSCEAIKNEDRLNSIKK